MGDNKGPAFSDDGDDLRHVGDWQRCSYQAGWRFPADWFVPEVTDLVHFGGDADLARYYEALRRLGAARAYGEVGIRETLRDLSAYFVAMGLPMDLEAVLELAEAWAEEHELVTPLSCTDVSTGLCTVEHFKKLVHDLSRSSTERQSSFRIATLHVEWAPCHHSMTMPLLAEIGAIVGVEFMDVEAAAAVHRQHLYILTPRSEQGYAALLHVYGRLEYLRGGAPGLTRITLTPLPVANAVYGHPSGAASLRWCNCQRPFD